jgi:RNA polymerase sigma-70 factor (ECF subfamily)
MPTSSEEENLLDLLRAGDEGAARRLFDTYANRLMNLARLRLSQRMARRIDPEDVVQSVFRTFFSRVRDGRFALEEQDDLSKLLVSITVRKTLRQVAFHKAAKRNPGAEEAHGDACQADLAKLQSVEPSPEAAVTFLDHLEHFLGRLRPQDRPILEMRLQGYRNEEIAQELGTSDRHVRRVLGHIRALAEEEELAP